MQGIAVIIPAYNEGRHIARVVKSIASQLKVGGKKFAIQVVVIDDGSSDNTAEEAKRAGAIVLRHVVNAGAGAATRTGLRYVERQSNVVYALTIDGDGQHASGDIKKLVEYAVKHDSQMIVGNRLHAANKESMPIQRRLINWAGSLFSRLLFGIKTQDTQSGLRLYSASTLRHVAYYTLDRYGFCTETLWHAVKKNITVHEVPINVSYTKEGMARGQSIWSSVEILRDLIRVRIAG